MSQFNNKNNSLTKEFTGSCLGKVIITSVVLFILFLLCVFTLPDEQMVHTETEDNVRQCLQENDSVHNDTFDEMLANISRSFSEADTTLDNRELVHTYHQFNRIEVYDHTFFRTAHIINYKHPQGVRVGIGIMGAVLSTIYFDDLVLNAGAVRGDYNEQLINPVIPEDDLNEITLQPYHYQGNPDN